MPPSQGRFGAAGRHRRLRVVLLCGAEVGSQPATPVAWRPSCTSLACVVGLLAVGVLLKQEQTTRVGGMVFCGGEVVEAEPYYRGELEKYLTEVSNIRYTVVVVIACRSGHFAGGVLSF